MSVYVDQLKLGSSHPEWRWLRSCRLLADSVKELHRAAKKLGVKRKWFQDHGEMKFYFITAKRRRRAVNSGIFSVTQRYVNCHFKENQKK